MTKRYPGGYITKTPPTVSTTSAPGIWTMEQQAAYQKAGTWPFGGPFVYVEDVFSTYLYTGTGSSGLQIQNGIDLAGKGGLVIGKARSGANAGTVDWGWIDTARGGSSVLYSNTTDAAWGTSQISSFNADGFTLNGAWPLNYYGSPYTYGSWTFRKQPKFFDVVTYTGNGTDGRNIAHSLGSVPGCIVIKSSSGFSEWFVYHRSLPSAPYYLKLNRTDAQSASFSPWSTAPTSTTFSVNDNGGNNTVNSNGETYVAYLFAHNAGGFGSSNTDNVISCGSYTGNGSSTGPTVTLGYEPQWVLVKIASGGTSNWQLMDTMRGMPVGSVDARLLPNSSSAEDSSFDYISPTATGFQLTSSATAVNANGATYIYIAIRRGPMKTPTSGTSVFAMDTQGSTTPRPPSYKSNFPVDWAYTKDKGTVGDWYVGSRLTGPNALSFNSTIAESPTAAYKFDYQNGWLNSAAIDSNRQSWMFQRAPGFFDVVCYTGTGSATTFNHNLGVAPELLIVKARNLSAQNWAVGSSRLPDWENRLWLNLTDARAANNSVFNSTAPTASVFTVGTNTATNNSGSTYVAYLFATCPGVSKVGSYTGTGTTLQIDCGFTGGARFVLIKRTDSTGDWYVWDSARGIVAGNDPYLLLNSTAAEVTSTDYVDTYAAGFEISSTAPAAINANGGTFIFLAIA